MTKQVRFIPYEDCGLQVREPMEGQSESRVVEGKPIIFGVRSKNLTPWSESREVYEVLEPGCISQELLMRSDVVLNINHSNRVTDILGRFRKGQGTLQLALLPNHMDSRCDLPRTNCANDTLELIRRGDISGMSFAFEDDREDTENGVSYERTDEKTPNGKEVWIRHVKRITALYDVSIVTNPAYEQTTVGVREQSDAIDAAIEEQLKRECGDDEAKKKAAEEEAKKKAEAEAKAKEEEEKAAAAKREQEEREAKEKEERERTNMQRHMCQRAHINREHDIDTSFYC